MLNAAMAKCPQILLVRGTRLDPGAASDVRPVPSPIAGYTSGISRVLGRLLFHKYRYVPKRVYLKKPLLKIILLTVNFLEVNQASSRST